MKKLSALTLTLLVSGSVVSGSALADEAKKDQMLESEAEFVSLDADKDGALSQQEASVDKKLMDSFAQADADSDGQITRKEYILYSGDATAAGN